MSAQQRRWFEVYRARDGWRWRLWSGNGRIIAESGEAYVQRHGCLIGLDRVKHSQHATTVVRGQPL